MQTFLKIFFGVENHRFSFLENLDFFYFVWYNKEENRKKGKGMVILGIDPGIATMGYGVIEKDGRGQIHVLGCGVVTTPKEERLPTRLALLEDGVEQLLKKYEPDEIALEELFFTKNVTNGIAVAHARGVIVLTCVKRCPYLYEYTPMQIKQALTGYGRADKLQMQRVVTNVLKLDEIPRPDDAADALAIAVCHASVSKLSGMFAVGNMTRTKGKNTVSGSAFEKLIKTGELPSEEKKKKQTVKKKPAVKPMATAKPAARKPAGTASAEIAAALAAKMRAAEEEGK